MKVLSARKVKANTAVYNIGFIVSSPIDSTPGIHKKVMNIREFCANKGSTPIAHVVYSKNSDTLVALLVTLGYDVIQYINRNEVDIRKTKVPVKLVDDAVTEVVSRAETVILVGDNKEVEKLVPSNKAVWVYQSVKDGSKEKVIDPLEVVKESQKLQDEVNKSRKGDPYGEFWYVKDYKKPEIRPFSLDPNNGIPDDIRTLIPPNNQGPFANK